MMHREDMMGHDHRALAIALVALITCTLFASCAQDVGLIDRTQRHAATEKRTQNLSAPA